MLSSIMKNVPYLLHTRAILIAGIIVVILSTLIALVFVPSTLPKDLDRSVGAAYDFAPLNTSGYEDFINLTRPTPDIGSESYPVENGGNPIQITQITITQFVGSQLTASVTLMNTTTEAQSGIVWVLLAPPDSPQPWTNAVYTTPEIPIRLSAQTSETIQLIAENPPTGEFDLSAWVHVVNPDGTRIHSDGQGFSRVIDVGNPYELEAAWENGTLIATAHSRLSTSATFALSVTISPNDDSPAWEAPPIERIVFDLTSGETLTRPFPIRTDGSSHLIVWLHQRQGDVFRLVASRRVITP